MSTRRISSLVATGFATLALAFGTGDSLRGQSAMPAALEVRISPEDTSLTIDGKNYISAGMLMAYTWPDYRPANAILMKLNMPALPAGAVIQEAKLYVRLMASDAKPQAAYKISAHKILAKTPVVARATGYTSDGQTPWTANTCCHKGVPLAQADISPAYDTQAIDKTPGFKAWTITSIVQEWIADPAANRGLLLNADALALRDRYRYFASMEHPDPAVRPFLAIRYSTAASDMTPPNVTLSNPLTGTRLAGTITVAANATDDVGVVGVQFLLDGAPLGSEVTIPPYARDWDTTTVSDGTHTLVSTARDSAGHVTTSPTVEVTVANGIVRLNPQDTSLNIDANNYSSHANLWAYTWPDYQPANAILLKFDIPALPSGARVDEAKLHLALVQSDASADAGYTMTAHKIVGKTPIIGGATGYTADGQNAWTPNGCCSNGVPMAQGDLSPAYDTRVIDKAAGVKTWTITTMVQEWLTDPSSNAGMIINPDVSASRDRFRFFASMDHADAGLRPFLQIKYSIDNIPPTASISAPSNGASVSSTVNVAAAAADNTGVAGVQFKLDGANLGSEVTAAPYSQSWNSKTVANGSHTLTAVARDASGNTTTSAAVVVNVANDVTAPAVAITAPAAAATVSGTVSVAAAASDNVGVAGVQFKLDGVSLGVEDSTAPYAIAWSTTSATNGSHTLTAIARDAAGNLTASSPVTITVSNGVTQPMPSGGIATLYPGDAGIEGHPDVVFVDRFEETSLSTVFSRWSDILGGANMSLAADVPPGSPGSRSLNIPWQGGGVSNGGHLYKQLSTGVNDTLYVRYYVKYPTAGKYNHTGIWMGGFNPSLSWPYPQAGVKPVGNDRFIAAAEQNTQTGRFDHYDYWMNMRQSSDGKYWGNLLLNNPNVQAATGQWKCVEHMVKLNNPVTDSNGEHAIWLDGVKVSHLGKGFPNGTWSGGIFTQNASGSPFEGFRWRSDANLNLNWIWLQNYSPDDPAGFTGNMYFDHVVVAKQYIGCLSGGSSGFDTTAPVVTGTTASAVTSSGASIAWTTNEPSDTQVEYGVTTAYGNSTTLNSSLVTAHTVTLSGLTPGTLYHFRVRSRDAAGNLAVSGDYTFSTSAQSSGSILFESSWNATIGTSSTAVTDGGKWPNYWEFNNGTNVQLLSVVADGVNGHNALRVQQRGSSFAANVQVDNVVPASRDYYVRYYMKNDDTSSESDHIVTVDTWQYSNLTFMRKTAGATSWGFVMSAYGCGFTYPIGHWGPALQLKNGAWYRFEYHVDFIDDTHIQVHPRVYDAAGNLILSDADFRQQDSGSATWNGRSDWTLASYYAAGHSFCVNPTWMNDFGLGNNGQYGATDTGRYWYFAGFQSRTDTWAVPLQPR